MTTRQLIDMSAVMEALGRRRPVFYSESDFNHALSWQIHQDHPSVQIGQEVGNLIEGPDRHHVDIWLPDRGIAIELKHLTRMGVIIHEGEDFRLRDQSAQDAGHYGFRLDISRLEQITESGKARKGYAILLTNDHLHWNRSSKPDTNDAEFVLHEGRRIIGTLSWSPRTGAGTLKGKEKSIEIRGLYKASWREYSNPAGKGIHQVQIPAAPCETLVGMNLLNGDSCRLRHSRQSAASQVSDDPDDS